MNIMQVILLLYFTLLKGMASFSRFNNLPALTETTVMMVCMLEFHPKRPRADQIAGKTPESTDSEKIKYTTVQHVRNNESNYENLKVHHPDSAAR